MGRCIVCNKSAGPFYSLHKACLTVYQDVQNCLHTTISESVASDDSTNSTISLIDTCLPSENFSKQYFKTLFLKAWQKQADYVLSHSELNVSAAKKLLQFAEELEITADSVEPYTLTRLANMEFLNKLQNHQTISKIFGKVANEFELEKDESTVWVFEGTTKTEQQRYSDEQKWTIFNSLLNNLFNKSRYKELATKTEESGVFLITNQAIHYKSQNNISVTRYSDIHSITPMKNGVRIQPLRGTATPDTYYTGDGRFTYALLQHVQSLNK